jgi:hypothetical protein
VKKYLSSQAIVTIVISFILLLALSFLFNSNKQDFLTYGLDKSPNSMSTSAIGLAGLYKILEDSAAGAGRVNSLPNFQKDSSKTLLIVSGNYLNIPPAYYPGTVLIILPKYIFDSHAKNPSWVGQLNLRPGVINDQNFQFLDLTNNDIIKGFWPKSFYNSVNQPDPVGTVVKNLDPPANSQPFQDAPIIQLIKPGRIEPLIWSDDGVLFGHVQTKYTHYYILSDPDAVNNMGLGQGQNPLFAYNLIDFLRLKAQTQRPTLFFEPTLLSSAYNENSSRSSSYEPQNYLDSFYGPMLKFPMIIVTILALIAVLITILASIERFGGPAREPYVTVFGKAKLINNGSRMLTTGGHFKAITDSYIEFTIRRAAQITRAPKGLEPNELNEWLALLSRRLGLSKGPDDFLKRLSYLRGSSSAMALLTLAKDAHSWKEELERGPSNDSRHSQ